MRILYAALLALLPLPMSAETIQATSQITAVTLFPEGARITREVRFDALSSSTQIAEQAVLEVKNLTDDLWPVRLMDLVPCSEQEDLEITFTADPAPSEENVEGQRGVLAWDFDLAPGEARSVTLTHALPGPGGMDLRSRAPAGSEPFRPQNLRVGDRHHPDMAFDHRKSRVQQRIQPVRPDQADHRDHARPADLALTRPAPRPARPAQHRQHGEPGDAGFFQRLGQPAFHRGLDDDFNTFGGVGLHISLR